MKVYCRSAFTLVEVLTGIVVFALISTCSWFAVSTLFRGEQLTSNRTIAINLLQKSQEELRKSSQTFYDQLEICQFPGPAFVLGSNLECGLQNLDSNFINYNRVVKISPYEGSNEIKQAIITVNWKDQGKILSMSSAILLARPPDPLPGNVIGTVRSTTTGNPLIEGVMITLTKDTISQTANSGKTLIKSKSGLDVNFNFNDTTTKAFTLPVGTWKLDAKHPKYYDYKHPTDIIVSSNSELPQIDFLMDPKPEDATIHLKLINAKTKLPLINFFNGRYWILDDYIETGKYIAYADNLTGADYAIKFKDTNPQSFTINTYWAYRSGYAGKPSCNGYPYNYHGWSSATVKEDNFTPTCSNPYVGSKASDRITVNPGDNLTVEVPLFPVPTATVKGRVIDEITKAPLAGATVYAQWPFGDWWYKDGFYPFATSDADGNYTYTVPAVQMMTSGSLRIQARRNMPSMGCCETPTTVDRYSNWISVNGLFEGSIVEVDDLKIKSADPFNCGNVKGNITNAFSGAAINNATITILGSETNTNALGNYIYQCPSVGYRLPAGAARFLASESSYYPYDNNGNTWYNTASAVNIKSNEIVDYPAKLWPIGRGTIIFKIVDEGTDYPIKGAEVKLTLYNSSVLTLKSDDEGSVIFNNVLETWPPIDLPLDDLYFKGKVTYLHKYSVTPPSNLYKTLTDQPTPVLKKEDTLTIPIRLPAGGGT